MNIEEEMNKYEQARFDDLQMYEIRSQLSECKEADLEQEQSRSR